MSNMKVSVYCLDCEKEEEMNLNAKVVQDFTTHTRVLLIDPKTNQEVDIEYEKKCKFCDSKSVVFTAYDADYKS